MKRRIPSIVLMILWVLFFSNGCASVGNDSLRAESESSVNSKIQEGITTKAEIKELFGPPISTSYTDGGCEIWKYSLSKISADATSYIPLVNVFAGSASGTVKELTILYDNDNKVKKFNMSESPIKTRTGLFNQ